MTQMPLEGTAHRAVRLFNKPHSASRWPIIYTKFMRGYICRINKVNWSKRPSVCAFAALADVGRSCTHAVEGRIQPA